MQYSIKPGLLSLKLLSKPYRTLISCVLFQLRYFKDPVARCMQGIDNIDRTDLSQKCEFFSNLSQAIPKFPAVSSTDAHYVPQASGIRSTDSTRFDP